MVATVTAATPAAQSSSSPISDVLDQLQSTASGLSTDEARVRLERDGPNAVRSHRVNPWSILVRQFANAVLILLAGTAVLSIFLGDTTQAVIILVILVVSVGLGFFNEYRAERATAALHSRVHHQALVIRDGAATMLDVTDLVVGDVVTVTLGQAVPADLRVLSAAELECDESILTGESEPSPKSPAAVQPDSPLAEMSDIAFMGTIVSSGTGTGVVVATGRNAEFGRIAAGLGDRHPQTAFQSGLKQFSYLLLGIAIVLTIAILVINVMLQRPIVDSVLFALAIAVGITPQLLPAVVSASLAAGSRILAKQKVLVKRLVSIEDLGDIEVLVTDKTGTLTEGRITLISALDTRGDSSASVLRQGLQATDVDPHSGGTSSNAMDAALWEAPDSATAREQPWDRVDLLPFDHKRRATSALIVDGQRRIMITKGAPEQVMAACVDVPAAASGVLEDLFGQGRRVVAVASKPVAPDCDHLTVADEQSLHLDGFLVFADQPKVAARESLKALDSLGIVVKVATGDNALVAEKVCSELGLVSGGTILGPDIDRLDDHELADVAMRNTIFARVSPEQKARILTALRTQRSSAFLGDGVNDALALHAADVGISVDTATDVAKDAADVVLLEKDLGVLASGVATGRRIFANTMKYVLMGTSSNFGNMFSAAAASAFLSFLPMLPSQILLNNLLYDSSQLAIPTDNVDVEQLRRPSHWDIGFIRRFMTLFGPISSLFDFLTFGLMLGVLHAGVAEFRTGWFVESIATQTLIIFVIRTRRIPFFRSRPSGPLVAAMFGVIAVGVVLTVLPFAGHLGFTALPWQFYLALVGLIIGYLVVVELAKWAFYADPLHLVRVERGAGSAIRRINRRASRFSTGD